MAHGVRGELAQDQGQIALHLRVNPPGDRTLENTRASRTDPGVASNRRRT